MEENPVSSNTIQTENSCSIVEENPNHQSSVDNNDKESPNETEYDSAGSYSEDREYKEKTDESGAEIDSDVEGSIILERQEGDGQESIPQKKVDDDEDKKNPQYIPKRGTFYEHDDRTADDIEAADAEENEQPEKEGKKKLWQEKKERWSHDRFNDNEQIPKTKAELIQIYGYDIRNEDGPPRARRRRRYGRGPNKYTRNWEDEDAYNKPVPLRPAKKPQNVPTESIEEFPPLDSQNKRANKPADPHKNNRENTNRNNWQNNRRSEEREKTPLIDHPQNTNNDSKNKQSDSVTPSSSSGNKNSKLNSGNMTKSKNESVEPKNIRDSDYKGFTTKMRLGRTNFKSQQNNSKNQKKDDFIESQNFSSRRNNNSLDKEEQALDDLMCNMAIQDSKGQERNQGKGQNNQRQGSVPPRLQGEQKGSKRYSSIRQRSLPETNNPPMLPHPSYYANELNQPQGAVIHQNPNLLQTPAGITQLAAPPAISISQQVPVTATPILQAPPQFGPPFPQAPAFIQAAVPPPTYLPQQATPLINYVQTTPQYSAGYQGYQAPFNPVSQPTELYQPQGGITYYSTDQQISQRIAPLKRPKAAIPIVAPPTFDPRRGEEERQADYISENNSVE